MFIALYLFSSGGVPKDFVSCLKIVKREDKAYLLPAQPKGSLPFGNVVITDEIKLFGWTHAFGLIWYQAFFSAC